ncbi:MAG: OmpH family outer membrane protein [Bacteroidota bacterium]
MNRGIVWLAIVLVAAGVVYSIVTRPKSGYIDIHDVYQKFDLKKELEKKFISVRDERKKITDSLELGLKLMETKLRAMKSISDDQAAEFQTKREFFVQKAREFEEDNKQLSAQYDKEILDQLNQYVRDYGAAKGYDYIYGNDSNGSLMYGDKKLEITAEVLEYINAKYKGIK